MGPGGRPGATTTAGRLRLGGGGPAPLDLAAEGGVAAPLVFAAAGGRAAPLVLVAAGGRAAPLVLVAAGGRAAPLVLVAAGGRAAPLVLVAAPACAEPFLVVPGRDARDALPGGATDGWAGARAGRLPFEPLVAGRPTSVRASAVRARGADGGDPTLSLGDLGRGDHSAVRSRSSWSKGSVLLFLRDQTIAGSGPDDGLSPLRGEASVVRRRPGAEGSRSEGTRVAATRFTSSHDLGAPWRALSAPAGHENRQLALKR